MCLPKKEKKKDYRDVGIWDDIRGGNKTRGLDDIMIFIYTILLPIPTYHHPWVGSGWIAAAAI
jgi:hypothetical protein